MKRLSYKRIAFSPITHLIKETHIFVDSELDKQMAVFFGFPEERILLRSDILGG